MGRSSPIGQVDQELALRGYSRRTRKNYRMQAVRFLRWLKNDPAIASEAELRQYLQAMADSERLSASYCNQAQATLNIIYERVLHRPEKVRYLPRMKEPKQLPLVDIRYIQELLGHDRLETTQRYTHVAQKDLKRIRSPLDRLDVSSKEKGGGRQEK